MSDRLKASYPKKSYVIDERSDVDPHEEFNPEKEGMEEWGPNFWVTPEAVVVERGPDGRIIRTTPISEATQENLKPKLWKEGELIEADPVETPAPRRMQDKIVYMMAGLLMQYYSTLRPGQISYNPLYDGIPAKAALGDKWILQPEKTNAELVHVTAAEVHEWLKSLLATRAKLIDSTQKTGGYRGDISDTIVRLSR